MDLDDLGRVVLPTRHNTVVKPPGPTPGEALTEPPDGVRLKINLKNTKLGWESASIVHYITHFLTFVCTGCPRQRIHLQ